MAQFTKQALRAICLISLLWGGPGAVAAGAPRGIGYQGLGLAADGSPINGTRDVLIRIYRNPLSPAAADQVYQENHPATNFVDGVFSVVIGTGSSPSAPFDAALFSTPDLWLELQLDGEILAPRVKFQSAAYALQCVSADTAANATNSLNATNAINSTTSVNATTALNATNATTAQNALSLGGMAASQYVLTTDARLADARTPTAGSASYIQNRNTPQASTDFNISGNGTAGGTLSGAIVDATTQFNLGGSRILTNAGTSNLFVGIGAGTSNPTGFHNTYVGRSAGNANATGIGNSFFGDISGFLSSGSSNSFFGTSAGYRTTGDGNSFFGRGSGTNNTTGTRNAFFGLQSGLNSSTANDNSFFGYFSGIFTTSGSGNSFFGKDAGRTNTTGTDNTIIGHFSDLGSGNLNYAGAIGYRALVESSNSLVLGSVSGKNFALYDTKVGIGTTAPGATLDVEGQLPPETPNVPNLRITNFGRHPILRTRYAAGTRTSPTATLSGSSLFTITADGHTGTAFTSLGQASVVFKASENWTSAANGTSIRFATTPNGSTAEANRMVIDHDGEVGIGTLSPDRKLDVSGDVRIGTGTTGCLEDRDGTVIAGTCSSDLRFKRDVTPIGGVLDGFSKLRPVDFSWRTEEFPERHFGKGRSWGFIAQEVEEIFPELVSTDERGYKAVNYSKLPIYTVAAFNELKTAHEAELETQRATIRAQQARIDRLERALCGLGAELETCD